MNVQPYGSIDPNKAIAPVKAPKQFQFVVAIIVVLIPFSLAAYLAINIYQSHQFSAEYDLPLDINQFNNTDLPFYISEETPDEAVVEEKTPEGATYLGLIKSPITLAWSPEHYPLDKQVTMHLTLRGDGNWQASITCDTCVEAEKDNWQKIEYISKRQSGRTWADATVTFNPDDFRRIKEPRKIIISIRSRAIEIHEEKTAEIAERGFIPVSAFDSYWLWAKQPVQNVVTTASSVSDWISHLIPSGAVVDYNPKDITDTTKVTGDKSEFYLQLLSNGDSPYAITTATYKVLPQIGKVSLYVQ